MAVKNVYNPKLQQSNSVALKTILQPCLSNAAMFEFV